MTANRELAQSPDFAGMAIPLTSGSAGIVVRQIGRRNDGPCACSFNALIPAKSPR